MAAEAEPNVSCGHRLRLTAWRDHLEVQEAGHPKLTLTYDPEGKVVIAEQTLSSR